MSNKQQLQTNNEKLDVLITRVNAAKDTAASLPEAGGGSDVTIGSYTGTINIFGGLGGGGIYIFYTDENLIPQGAAARAFDQITVAAGTAVVLPGLSYYDAILSNVENFNGTDSFTAVIPTSNDFYIGNQ